jgi:Mrp family chromosome partitioning ATPase
MHPLFFEDTMEPIRQAVERAKATGVAPPEPQGRPISARQVPPPSLGDARPDPSLRIKEVQLDRKNLENYRLIAHNAADPRASSFDMLRTQVLQSMDQRNWQFLAVTSPTAGCGKTVTSINLALSIARQPERAVFLVDLDLHRPQVASCLGIKCQNGLLSVLDGRSGLPDAMVQARIDSYQFLVLPTEGPILGSSELLASRAMSSLLQTIKRDFKTYTVILDMPPMLTGDDVIALLPQLDCVLLVAAVGTSTLSELKQCSKHLQSAEVVRVVLNKTPDSTVGYG